MGKGGGGRGRRSLPFSHSFFPFSPETPDTQAKLSDSHVMHQSIPPAPSPPPPGYCGAFARLVSPGGGAFAIFALPGGREFASPGPFPSF